MSTADRTDRRRVIERPRLTSLLDGTNARIILLTAPAGYGKTTLAVQWLNRRSNAWYRGSPASADVAALALGLAVAAAESAPGADDRLRERLRATNQPEEETDILAELLAEDIAGWPADAWLVIDDYQYAMEAAAAERFVERLTELAPLRLLVTSRNRPTWATARRILYGDIFELDRDALAMSDDEALEVLVDRGEHAPALVARAEGWPAVIGLAALTESLRLPDDDLPTQLYDYFAEEVYLQAEPAVRWGLCQLAVAPTITTDLAQFLFGHDAASLILEHAVRLGVLLSEGHERYALHPLLRGFLESKLRIHGVEARSPLVARLQESLVASEAWDDAFSLIEHWGDASSLEHLIETALEPLLTRGRLPTLERWLAFAQAHAMDSPVIDLAIAEIAFRRGEHRLAHALAVRAGKRFDSQHPLRHRAFFRAGQSASLSNRLDLALTLHRRAQTLAKDPAQLREALHGQLLAAVDLELSEVDQIANAFRASGDDEPTSIIRLSNGELFRTSRTGGVDDAIREAEAALPLLSQVDDPLIRSSFLNMFGGALVLAAQYDRASELGDMTILEAERYRLDFVLPHVFVTRAVSEFGRRRFRRANAFLRRAEAIITQTPDPHTEMSLELVRIRIELALGRESTTQFDLKPDLEKLVSKSMMGESLAVTALSLACAGSHEAANELIARVDTCTKHLEGRSYAAWADVILRLIAGSSDANELAAARFREYVDAGFRDPFVSAYRGHPQLLAAVSADDELLPKVSRILTWAHDQTLAKAAGVCVAEASSERTQLSRRETEVHELMTAGLTNREIAQTLFISEATVKVHVRRVLQKLGVRSRTEAALKKQSDAD